MRGSRVHREVYARFRERVAQTCYRNIVRRCFSLLYHNRGANCCFGEIHTLNVGDTITLTTKLGTRTYAVTSVAKVSEADRSGLAATSDNTLTLYTCVRDQRAYRWCVTAVEMP